MSAADPVVGEIGVSVETFINTVFKHKKPESIIYVGPKHTSLKTFAVIDGLQKSKNDRKNTALFMGNCTYLPEATESGAFKRLTRYADEFHIVMLDDIISKFPEPDTDIFPTYVLETSEENFQFGYALDRGYTAEEYHTFQARLKKKKISDGGACGLNKLYRINAGVNGKNKSKFRVRLDEWNPDCEYSLDALAKAFELPDLTAEESKFVQYLGGHNPATAAQIEKAPILETLHKHVEIKEIEEGKIHIVCPNHAAHTGGGATDGKKDSTLFVREDGSYTYSCLHGHCIDDQFSFDDWHNGLIFAELRPIIENLPVPASSMFESRALAAVANVDNLLDRIVVMRDEKGGFYDLQSNSRMNVQTLNMVYGHMPLPKSATSPSLAIKKSEHKRLADGVGWLPVDELFIELDRRTLVNTYRPILTKPVEGDVSQWLELMTHIWGEHDSLVLDHMAYTVQHPERKIKWACINIGPQRTGKTLSVRPLLKLFGDAGVMITPDNTDTGWGDIHYGKKVQFYEELHKPGDRKFFNQFKLRLGNDDTETLNIKTKGMVTQPNLASIYATTNDEDAIRAGLRELEKMLVVAGPPEKIYGDNNPESAEFYTDLFNAIDYGDMVAHVYWFLLHRDVSEFSHGRNPSEKTAMFDTMVAHSKPDWLQVLEEHIGGSSKIWVHGNSMPLQDVMRPGDLHTYIKKNINERVTLVSMDRELKANGYMRAPEKGREKCGRVQCSFWITGDRVEYENMTICELLEECEHPEKKMQRVLEVEGQG